MQSLVHGGKMTPTGLCNDFNTSRKTCIIREALASTPIGKFISCYKWSCCCFYEYYKMKGEKSRTAHFTQ